MILSPSIFAIVSTLEAGALYDSLTLPSMRPLASEETVYATGVSVEQEF